MKCRLDQLTGQLSKKLLPIYLVHGDEPLLVQQAIDQIKQTAKSQGFDQCQRLQVNTQFKWPTLSEKFASLDLFTSKTSIHLTMPSGKPGTTGTKAIQAYLADPNPDNLLIISCDKLAAASLKTAWYKAVEQHGAVIAIWPLKNNELKQWLVKQCKTHDMTITDDALSLLAQRVTGNLLAGKQEIEKLFLLYGATEIDSDKIHEATTDVAHFEIFDLVDAWLDNDIALYARILQNLKAQNIAPTLILWSLTRDIRQLAKCALQCEQGSSANQAVQSIPAFRRSKLQKHLQQHNTNDYHQLLRLAYDIDQIIKGAKSGNVWDALINFSLTTHIA